MATSQIPAVLDYLVTTFTNASTLGAATPPVTIWDGPVLTGEAPTLILFVGADDPDTEDALTGATSEQSWAGLGAQRKNEQFQIYCVAEAWSGETDVKAARTAAFAIVGAVENLLRGDVMLGGIAQFQGITGNTLRQYQDAAGARARVMFQIEGQARI